MSNGKSVIHKHHIDAHGRQIPAGRVIHVGTQFDTSGVEQVYAWVQHGIREDGEVFEDRKMRIKVVGTGHAFDHFWVPEGTAQLQSARLVVHVVVDRRV